MLPGRSAYEKGFALNKELEQRLALVNHALEKVEAGTYGKCDVCQKHDPSRET